LGAGDFGKGLHRFPPHSGVIPFGSRYDGLISLDVDFAGFAHLQILPCFPARIFYAMQQISLSYDSEVLDVEQLSRFGFTHLF
jgi:hypothetical protein